jgi:hypothetical protein
MYDKRRNGSITIQTSKRWLALFAVLILAPWLTFLIHNASAFSGPCPRPHETDGTQQPASEKGPWGDLRIISVVTEPPDEAWVGQLDSPSPTWFFKGYSTNDFKGLLRTAGLSAAQQAELESAAVWSDSIAGYAVKPQDDFVMGLSPASRAALYNALSHFTENLFQNEPFRFKANLADEWFANSDVPAATVAMVRKLTYTRGSAILFSDPHLVLPKLGSDLERAHLLKTLSRQSTLMVKLHVTPETDLASLVGYWTMRHGSAKDIRPILESAARIPGGFDVDITHFLPRFARKRIYTYPSSDGDSGELTYDCHWSSMNFWNDPPDNRFADKAYVIRTLETDYAPVLDSFKFGDIVLFMKSNTEAIHSAVYVADNIVFTKNGPSPYSPWILMRMDSLISHYETTSDLTIRGYRKRSKP